jgi:hypothetical protein
MKTPISARIAAVFYALWGLAHLAGGIFQLLTLRTGGGSALTALISTASPGGTPAFVPGAATAFMGMGAANIAVVGAIVCGLSILNWRNSASGYWLSLLLVGAVDLNLVAFLLAPGVMAWTDGLVGLSLFAPAAVLSTIAQMGEGASRLDPATAA